MEFENGATAAFTMNGFTRDIRRETKFVIDLNLQLLQFSRLANSVLESAERRESCAGTERRAAGWCCSTSPPARRRRWPWS